MNKEEKNEGVQEDVVALAVKQIATPGDAAAFLLGGAAGLPIDFFLMHMGVPFGVVSVATSAFALGLKKTADSLFSGEVDQRKKDLEKEYDDLTEYLNNHPNDPASLGKHLRESHDKWKIKVVTSADFQKKLAAVRKKIAERKNGLPSQKGIADD
jgi:hypothetical protein